MKAKLNERQKTFADEYLVDLVAVAAFRRAGYKAKGNAADVNANRMLKDPRIQDYIQKRMKDRSKRTEITQDRVLQELALIGFAKITDYLKVDGQEYKAGTDEAGNPIMRRGKFVDIFETDNIDLEKLAAVSEIRQTKEGISIKLHDKVAALEKLGKHTGAWKDGPTVNVNVVNRIDFTNMTDEELERIANGKQP